MGRSTDTSSEHPIEAGGLDRALARGELELRYQPIVDLRTGGVRGVEAFVRWRHSRHGLIAAGEFVAAAEAQGAMVPIGKWVLQEACMAAAGWPSASDGRAPCLFVNVSPRQLGQPDFVETVQSAIAAAGMEPQRLLLEVTEGCLLQDAGAIERLARLTNLGVAIVLDDFGLHEWSPGYLARFPIQDVKLHGSVVSGETCDGSRLSLDAVAALAGTLSLNVIAEGVETQEQLLAVRERGFEFAQGHRLAKPLPAGMIARLLESGAPLIPAWERLQHGAGEGAGSSVELSHSLRTPLTSIRGYVEMMLAQEPDTSERRREYLGIIAYNAARLEAVVERLFSGSPAETLHPALRAEGLGTT